MSTRETGSEDAGVEKYLMSIAQPKRRRLLDLVRGTVFGAPTVTSFAIDSDSVASATSGSWGNMTLS